MAESTTKGASSPTLRRKDTHGKEFPGKYQEPTNILARIDHKISYRLYRIYEDLIGLRLPLMLLEFSGHGVPYIIVPLALILFWEAPNNLYYVLLANFFVGIITDLLWSVVLKPTVRRVRPYWAGQKQFGTVETVDQYSFPSGHSTRVIFVAFFAHYVQTLGLISEEIMTGIAVWAGIVCISRVFLGRHFFGDITMGILVGYVNFLLVRYLWVSEEHVMQARAYGLELVAMATEKFHALTDGTRSEL